MNNKIKIPVARLRQIIQEEVSRFYELDEEEAMENESLLEEDELEEQISSTEMANRQVGADISSALQKLNAMPADQAKAKIKGLGL